MRELSIQAAHPIIMLAVLCLCSCSNPHESPMSVATAFQKAIQKGDYKAARSLLSDTCKTLVVESDMKNHFAYYSSVLKEESTGRVLTTIGEWPLHRLVEFSANNYPDCVTDHVTVTRKGDEWYVAWVDHMAGTSLIDPNIDPFSTIALAHSCAQHGVDALVERRRRSIKLYEGHDLTSLLPNDRWCQDVRLRRQIQFGRSHHYSASMSIHWTTNFVGWPTEIERYTDLDEELIDALVSIQHQYFEATCDQFIALLECPLDNKTICFDTSESDYIKSVIVSYLLHVKDNKELLSALFEFKNRYKNGWRGESNSSIIQHISDLIASHVPSESNLSKAEKVVGYVRDEALSSKLTATIIVLKALQDNSSMDGNQQATKELSPEERKICLDAFPELKQALPPASLEGLCSCLVQNVVFDDLLANSAKCLLENRGCVEEYIFLPMNASSADKEAFYEGVERGGRSYDREDFAKACAKGIPELPKKDAIEFCGCIYDKAEGRGISVEALTGKVGEEIGAECVGFLSSQE